MENKKNYEMEFCVSCYLQHAIKLVENVLLAHEHDNNFILILRPGAAGSFLIKQDGKTIYSKKETGHLPVPEDIGYTEKHSTSKEDENTK